MAKKGGTKARPRSGVQPSVPGDRRRQQGRTAPSRSSAPAGVPGDGSLRWLVAGTWAFVAIFFWTAAADPINLPKLTVLFLGCIAVVGTTALRFVATGSVRVATGSSMYALYAFLVAAVIATIRAPVHGVAVYGDYRRNIGLLLYLCCAVLLVATARAFSERSIRRFVPVALGVGCLLAFYGFLQQASLDPVRWHNDYSPLIATLGNPDFASAFFGILVPLALWGVLDQGHSGRLRAASGAALAVLASAAYLTSSVQGPVAAVAGGVVVVLGWVLTRTSRLRKIAIRSYVGVLVLAAFAGIAGAAGVGPAGRIFHRAGVTARGYYWDAALSMFTHNPVVGVGMSMYGEMYRLYRSVAATRAFGPTDYSNTAHSVYLTMFATGGILLGLAYVAFVVCVGVEAVRLCLRAGGSHAQLLAFGVVGAWVAVQVQAIVSLDMVAIVVTQFVFAGMVLAMARATDSRSLMRLPVRAGRGSTLARAGAPATAVVVFASIVLAFFGTSPQRADDAVKGAHDALVTGDGSRAVAEMQHAVDLSPWQTAYWFVLAQVDQAVRRDPQATQALRKIVAIDPGNRDALVGLAQYSAYFKDNERAMAYYRRAIALDPKDWTLRVAAGKAALTSGSRSDLAWAMTQARAAQRLSPSDPSGWILMGDVEARLQHRTAAVAAYQHALALHPGDGDATARLAALKENGKDHG